MEEEEEFLREHKDLPFKDLYKEFSSTFVANARTEASVKTKLSNIKKELAFDEALKIKERAKKEEPSHNVATRVEEEGCFAKVSLQVAVGVSKEASPRKGRDFGRGQRISCRTIRRTT